MKAFVVKQMERCAKWRTYGMDQSNSQSLVWEIQSSYAEYWLHMQSQRSYLIFQRTHYKVRYLSHCICGWSCDCTWWYRQDIEVKNPCWKENLRWTIWHLLKHFQVIQSHQIQASFSFSKNLCPQSLKGDWKLML